MSEYNPDDAESVVRKLNDELELPMRSQGISLTYLSDGAYSSIQWLGYTLWDDNDERCETFLDDEEQEHIETVEACVRRRFDEFMRRFSHIRLTPPKEPSLLNQPMSAHTGDDYTVLLLGNQDTDNRTARIFGHDLEETTLIAEHITRLWNAARGED